MSVAINAKRLTFPPLLDKVVKILGNQGICYSNPSWNADDAFGGGKVEKCFCCHQKHLTYDDWKNQTPFSVGFKLIFPIGKQE